MSQWAQPSKALTKRHSSKYTSASDLGIWTLHPEVAFCLQTSKNNRNLPSLNIFSLRLGRVTQTWGTFTAPSFQSVHTVLLGKAPQLTTRTTHSRLVNNGHFRNCPACHLGSCILLPVEEYVMQVSTGRSQRSLCSHWGWTGGCPHSLPASHTT